MAVTAPAVGTPVGPHGPRHAAHTAPAPEATRDRLTATTLLDGAATKRAGRHLQPVRYVARWWDGTEYVPCLVVRTPRGRRRVVQLDSKVVVVTGRGRAARRALRKARASVSPAALPTRPVTAQVARITQDVDVRTCPWPGCGHLAVIPAPGLGGAGAFACGHDS